MGEGYISEKSGWFPSRPYFVLYKILRHFNKVPPRESNEAHNRWLWKRRGYDLQEADMNTKKLIPWDKKRNQPT